MPVSDRIHRISSELPPGPNGDALLLDQLTYEDALGRPFECVIDVLSENHSINDQDLLGTPLCVTYEPLKGEKRFIHGLVAELSYLGIEESYSRYRIVTRPWFWFLKHTTDSRIFQEMNVSEIVEEIFKTTHDFTDFRLSMTGRFRKREYCVQYRESDFAFVSRLLEEEGIYYYIQHEEKKHTLVLVDDSSSHEPIAGPDGDKIEFRLPGQAPVDLKHISQWTFNSRLRPTSLTIGDYNFTKPKADLTATSQVRHTHKMNQFEKYDFPGRYLEKTEGDHYAKRWLEEQQLEFNEYLGSGNSPAIATGMVFKLESHPRNDQNVKYLVTNSTFKISSAEVEVFSQRVNDFLIGFSAVKERQAYRTPRTTPRPIVTGPQSAVVVGKSGEEIWTDKFGRVKVHFPWDREGQKDENSSCWVRVSQNWAGKNWGAITIPRIGQEVLVEFLDGDPDRPIITGRVYNNDQRVPYTLPDNQTQSGLKTMSTKTGTADNFNELRFEDKKGEEQIYLHAEKDFEQVVENNSVVKIGVDKKDPGDQTIEVYNNRTLTVNQGNDAITVKQGNQTTTLERGNQAMDVKAGNQTISITAGKQETTAGQKILLKCGASSIEIGPAGIKITAPDVKIMGNATAGISAPKTDVAGSAMLMLQGGLVKVN